jgi:hypothetical protein
VANALAKAGIELGVWKHLPKAEGQNSLAEPKYSIHAIHGLDDRRILIAGLNFAAAKDRQISTTRVDARSPARWCS